MKVCKYFGPDAPSLMPLAFLPLHTTPTRRTTTTCHHIHRNHDSCMLATLSLMETNVVIQSSGKLWRADPHRRICKSEFVWAGAIQPARGYQLAGFARMVPQP
ncbi:hypothetical protein ACMFMG_000002 [Clarireedia jacksonii]